MVWMKIDDVSVGCWTPGMDGRTLHCYDVTTTRGRCAYKAERYFSA